MTEILTESYCERCGAKFTFESPAVTTGPLLRARTLARGLRNYLTSDESLDDALSEARHEQDRQASGIQLRAFHDTFSFCFTCRQYTCRDCWNEAAGRCRTCAPMPDAPDPLDLKSPEAEPTRLEEPAESESWVAARLEPPTVDALNWPATEPPEAAAVSPELVAAGEPLATVEVLPAVEVPPVPEAVTEGETPAQYGADGSEAALVEPGTSAVVVESGVETEAMAEPVSEPVAAVAEAIEAPEPEPVLAAEPVAAVAEAIEAPEPEPVLAAEPVAAVAEAIEAPEPEPVLAAEPVAAVAEAIEAPEPEPVLAAEPVAAVAEAIEAPEPVGPSPVPIRQPRPPAAGPTPWQVVAPDERPPAVPGQPGVQPSDNGAERQMGWLLRRREAPQPQVSSRITRSVWEESTRDLVARPGTGIQACQGCGLPLSANARFCRRCGSRQV